MDLTTIRGKYTTKNFDIKDLNKNPFKQFEVWFNDALNENLLEPNAFSLATVGSDMMPSIRTVLLKYFDNFEMIKANKYFELTKVFKGKEWKDFSEEYKSLTKSFIWYLWGYLWLLIGLFTVQWTRFLIILLFNILIIGPLSKITRFTISYTILHWVNSLIGFLFGVFIIINHYHLRIDLTEWVMVFLKLK